MTAETDLRQDLLALLAREIRHTEKTIDEVRVETLARKSQLSGLVARASHLAAEILCEQTAAQEALAVGDLPRMEAARESVLMLGRELLDCQRDLTQHLGDLEAFRNQVAILEAQLAALRGKLQELGLLN